MRSFRRIRVLLKLTAVLAAGILAVIGSIDTRVVGAFSTGPPPSFTGAPGEDNCAVCHTTFPVNSGKGSVSISGLPTNYLPGQPVEVQVTTTGPAALLFGFQLTGIDTTGATVGSFQVPTGPNAEVQKISGTINGHEREYVEQTSAGLFDPKIFGSKTWTFTWTPPAIRAGKVTFYAAGNAGNGNGSPDDDLIFTTTGASLSGSAIANFNGDLASDVAVFRPRTGEWLSRRLDDPTVQTASLGQAGDVAVPADYDGDGETDEAVYRPSNFEWRILRSTAGPAVITFGGAGALPVPGDYDGDGKADVALFTAANGAWTVQASTGGTINASLGQPGDKVAHADYDGDAKTDFAVFRPSTGTWHLQRSMQGPFSFVFGSAADRPVQADYDGDGRADLAYYRPSTGTWFINGSSAGSMTRTIGSGSDIPSPADYDGDGLADAAVFHAGRKGLSATYRVIRSSDGSTVNLSFGQQRDIPAASAYLAK